MNTPKKNDRQKSPDSVLNGLEHVSLTEHGLSDSDKLKLLSLLAYARHIEEILGKTDVIDAHLRAIVRNEPASFDIFLSYASNDIALAEVVYQRMTEVGFRVWFDRSRLRAGFNWQQEIRIGRDSSRIVMPILTPNWQLSEWCRFETYAAKIIIPLLMAGQWQEVATIPLQSTHYFDLRNANEGDWTRLYNTVHARLINLLSRIFSVNK